jgi:hypothetical protein
MAFPIILVGLSWKQAMGLHLNQFVTSMVTGTGNQSQKLAIGTFKLLWL